MAKSDLWSGSDASLTKAATKSIFDPCPKGWRIPPFLNNTSPFAQMATSGKWTNSGYTWSGNEGYFTASGYRSSVNGKMSDVNKRGFSWSATSSGANSYRMGFSQDAAVESAFGSSRANGFPVRCCKDNL